MAITFNATPITMKNATTPSLIHSMRQACGFMRGTASVVLIAFTLLTLQPLAAAARTASAAPPARVPDGPEQRFSHTVEQIETRLRRLDDTLAKRRDSRSERQELNRLKRSLGQLDQEVRRDFERTERHIADRGLANVIRQRHRDMVSRYRAEYQALTGELDAVEAAGDNSQRRRHARTALDRLKAQPHKRRQQPFDPHHLPNSTLKADPDNKPKETADAFTQAGLFDTPYPKLAALGDFTFDKLAGASNPAYLAESDEIVLTQAIKDKAAELQYDPVKIYHWVRNTIAWQPTWGGIQNADLTLSAKRGNAMDIASLTLALLRASKIPARYVHGTIDVPAAAFKNWAGGFTDINAAANFASSGGIPITSVVSGGQISKIRLEHIWVEAAIDFLPSRGARNRDADSWVAMDPSYKQYDYLTGLDGIAISGIDPEQLAQSFIASGTVNDSEGWVTGFDAQVLKDAQAQVQQKLQDYIQSQMQNPTVGDVIGGRKTIVQEFPMLPSGLPNPVKVIGSRYDKLPGQLQQKITWAFSKDILGDLIDPVSFPFAKVNNQKITLSFRPATEADEQALQSLLPAGEITDLSQLPTTIPSYLIRVVPELAVNGQIVKTGGALKLGEELPFITALSFAGRGQISSPRTYNVIAGSYLAVNAYAGSVSPAQLQAAKNRLEQTKTVLESADPTQIGALTQQELLGDLFHAGGLGYYTQLTALNYLLGLQAKAHYTLAAGTGTFGYEPNVDYLFGFPRAIKPGGVVFDIPLINVHGVNSGDKIQQKQFVQQTGIISSALEHAVPEQLFVNEQHPGEAISAVKALQKANAQGQRIYHITQANRGAILGHIHHDADTMDEIRNALNAGREVVTHTDAVSVPGWSGAGYIISDPDTGAGAYKISGGANGGWILIITGITLLALMAAGIFGSFFIPAALAPIIASFFPLFLNLATLLIIAGAALLTGNVSLCVSMMLMALSVLSEVIGVFAMFFYGAPTYVMSLISLFSPYIGVSLSQAACNR
jgi:transglutaminase-like putative cysteine protease